MGCKCTDCKCSESLLEEYKIASHSPDEPPFDIVGGRDGFTERVFYKETNPLDLQWHFDEIDRVVVVEDGLGWQFQFDDELPFDIGPESIIEIKANRYHRLIKNETATDLLIEVHE